MNLKQLTQTINSQASKLPAVTSNALNIDLAALQDFEIFIDGSEIKSVTVVMGDECYINILV